MKNKMFYLSISFVGLIITSMTACAFSQKPSQDNSGQDNIAEFQTYGSNLCNISKPEQKILTSQTELDQYKKLASLVDQPIDWQHQQALLVAVGDKMNAGFNVSLNNIRVSKGHWQVEKIEQLPQAGKLYAQMITTPCSLLVFDKNRASLSLFDQQHKLIGKW